MITFSNQIIKLIKDGRVYSLSQGDPRFKAGYKLLVDKTEDEFISLLSESAEKSAVKEVEGFRVERDSIFYKSFEIQGCLKTKIQSLIKEGLSLIPFVKFMEKASKNPSRQALTELWDFLNYRELAITLDGNFIAYKGVNNDYFSHYGNKKTVVLKGRVDDCGRIYNGIGETIEVERNQVDDDRNNECSFGLHAGSLEYSGAIGTRRILVEIDPADAVSVPTDCSFQKLRCCKYKVLADYKEEIQSPVVSLKGGISAVEPPLSLRDKVRRYIMNKIQSGESVVSVRKIAKAIGQVTQAQVAQIVAEQGYSIENNEFDV